MGAICFFIGHREAPESIFSVLLEAVERHIVEHDVTEFVVGRYGNFDSLAARAVKKARQSYPEVKLTLLLPYHPAGRPIEPSPGFTGSFYPPDLEKVPKRLAIVRANRWMVVHSDFLIAYANHPASNTRKLVEYAQSGQRKIRVENLAEVDSYAGL